MPGLTGIIGGDNEQSTKEIINKMTSCMLYERFYEKDIIYNKQMKIGIGWTWFKDHTSCKLPIWNENYNIFLVISGNIFIEEADLECLKNRGHHIHDNDFDWLIHLYEEHGEEIFDLINGQFAAVLVDLRKNITYLFNDSLGFGRIYYREVNQNIYFSTEAKCLLRIFPDCRELDITGLSEMLVCGCTLRNHTLFKRISILPPGNVWKFDSNLNKRMIPGHKYELTGDIVYKERETYKKEVLNTFKRILPKYLNTKRPIGMSITGGRDSRIILSHADLKKADIRAYTFGSAYRENRDEKIGRQLAKACGIPHMIIKLDNEFIKLFQKLAEKTVFITDGLMDVSGSTGLYTNNIARNISNIRLTGNYGQEVFEGYVAFKPTMISERFVSDEFRGCLKEAYNNYWQEKGSCDRYTFVFLKQLPWHHYIRYKLESSQVMIYAPFIDKGLISILNKASLDLREYSRFIRLELPCLGNPILAMIETDLGYRCCNSSLINRFNNMIYNISFKAEYAYDHGMPNWLALFDYILKPLHVEKMFLGRNKYYHFRVWYREKLSNYIKEILLDSKTLKRPYIDKRKVERIVFDHLKGIRNHTFEIHKLLTLEFINRQFIEGGMLL